MISRDCRFCNYFLPDNKWQTFNMEATFSDSGVECIDGPRYGVAKGKRRDHIRMCKNKNLLLVTRNRKPADLSDLTGAKYMLISNAMIAKTAATKIREKYPNTKKEFC